MIFGASFLGLCLALIRFARCRAETVPLLLVSSIISLLYSFAYFNQLHVGADLIVILGLLSFLLSPWYLPKNRAVLLRAYFPPGFVIPVGFIVALSLLASQSYVGGIDEFAHWAAVAKWVFIDNGFVRADNLVSFKSYPLGGALFYYLFFHFHGYKESLAFVAQTILLLAPLAVLFEGFPWVFWKRVFVAFASVLFVFMVFFHVQVGFTNNLYLDSAVGIFLGTSLVFYLRSKRDIASILWLVPPLFAFLQLKPNLAALSCLVPLIILTDQRISLRRLVGILILVGFMLLSAWSWYHYFASIHVHRAWVFGQINFVSLTTSQKATVINFVKNLIQPALISLIFWLLVFLNRSKASIRAHLWMQLGLLGYLATLLSMYLYMFSGYEGEHLASMHRYLEMYYIAWFLVVCLSIAETLKARQIVLGPRFETASVICVILGFSSLLIVKHVIDIQPRHRLESVAYLREAIRRIAVAAKRKTPEHAKIFNVWQNSDGFEHLILSYELIPRYSGLGRTSFGLPYSSIDRCV